LPLFQPAPSSSLDLQEPLGFESKLELYPACNLPHW
jgi:hypothetical protein